VGVGDTSVTAPRASVIVPVRDRRQLLGATLDALAAQTFTEHEVIVIDDGSRDGSGDEARRRAAAGQPVRVLDGAGRGAVAARVMGVDAARADVLAFTDSDCRPEPGWLAAGLAAIESGAAVVQGPTVPDRMPRPLERTVSIGREDGLYATCNVFYRRDAYEAAGGFDVAAGQRLGFRPGSRLRGLGFGEDVMLGWAVRRQGGTSVFAPDAVVRHHVFPADRGEAFRRAWNVGGFPALIRDVPELRSTLLQSSFILEQPTRLPIYASTLLALAGRRTAALLVLGAWVGMRARRLSLEEPSRRRRLKVVPAALAVDVVTATALAVGSARSRTVVL
jgi:glycosyltransferase involved in cell wall biosynthesis